MYSCASRRARPMDDPDRLRFQTDEFYLKSEEELRALFAQVPEAFANTEEIARRCNVEITFGKYHLPAFRYPAGYDGWSYFRKALPGRLRPPLPR